MNEIIAQFSRVLTEVILPNLKAVQASQKEQIAANDRLENNITELHSQLESQFAHLSAQLTACRAELAATHALLKATQMHNASSKPERPTLVH